jgi:hypothetical protein
LATTVAAGTHDGNASTNAVAISDVAGNSTVAQFTGIKVDLEKPDTSYAQSPAANGADWNNTNVDVTLSANDHGGSGVDHVTYSIDGGADVNVFGASASFTLSSEGVHTIHYHAVDNAGNAEADQSKTVRIDKTAPTITILSPVDGSTYMLGAAVNASYSCSPGSGSPLSSCAGPVISGAPISTTPASVKTFTVNASDAAGNTASLTYTYNIGNLNFLQPIDGNVMNIAKLGRVVPVKANIFRNGSSLTQGQGPISIGGAAPIPCGTAAGSDDIEVYAAGSSNTANQFRWDTTGGFWIYNLDTSSLKSGNCYRLDVFYGGTADATGKVDLNTAFRVGYFYLQVTK